MSLAFAILSIEEDPPVYGVRAAVDALRYSQCKWPINEVRAPDFHFCTSDRLDGKPYCALHAALSKRLAFKAE